MPKVPSAPAWMVLLAALLLPLCSCGTRSADPNALPAWIAAYPGSTARANGSAFVFQTKDPAETILDFYERQLERNGVHKEARGGGEYGGFLSAADDSHSRNVMVEVHADKGTSEVIITPVQKK
ncbi:MAG TPA: hypothetical protein VGQ49_00580 [Bryobacteraceae bacterium]|nr:hypothetical protein [Bryobacteraceae bacterium]